MGYNDWNIASLHNADNLICYHLDLIKIDSLIMVKWPSQICFSSYVSNPGILEEPDA